MFTKTLFAQENFCGVFSSMVTYFFLSMYYIRLKFTHRYYLLFKVSFGNHLIVFFITVMQKNRNKKVYIQRRNELLN